MIVWQKSKTRFVLIRTHQLDTSIATIIYILQLYLYQISTNFYIAVTATYIREIQPQIHNRDTDLIRIATSPFAPLTEATKNLMVNRYKLDPTKLSANTPFLVTSEQNYHKISNLIKYTEWLSKHLKNNLVYKIN